MTKKIIWIKIDDNNYYRLLLKINNIGVSIFEIKKQDNYILIKTFYDDYKKLKKYLISYKITIYSKTGLYRLKEIITKYKIFMISIIFGIILLFGVNNMIFKVEIKTNNNNIKEKLTLELENYGLKKLSLKKNHNKIEKIVKEILNKNKNTIEWLEIKYDGLIMIVNVTEKIDKDIISKKNNCNIIAEKDAKIISLNLYRGIALKEINDYVNKGDILISGSIIQNEEIKNMVCASGEIYGEVWYKVKVNIPFIENYKNYTGKNRFNLNVKINDDIYTILKKRIKNKEEKTINLYKLNEFEINLIKEKEYIEKTRKLTEEEAFDKGINLVVEKVKLLLEKDESILLKKVLKKEINDSTIYLEIFIVTKENIGQLQVVEEE